MGKRKGIEQREGEDIGDREGESRRIGPGGGEERWGGGEAEEGEG